MRRGRRPDRVVCGAFVITLACAAFLGIGASAAIAAPPALTIDPVTTSATTTAHASGEVSVPADGNETYWCFEYAEEGESNWTGFCYQGPVQPGGSTKVEADLTGLKAGTPYEVRLAGLNFAEFVEEFSSVEKFETDPAPVTPAVTLAAATPGYTSAQIQGAIDPEGGNEESGGAYVPIHWALQLSESGDPGSFNDVASGDLTGAEAESDTAIDVPASPAELTGLSLDHTYTYRLLVTYAGQTVEPPPTDTFTTLAVAKPTPSVDPVTAFTATTAHLVGHINPNAPEPEGSTSPAEDAAFETSWHFECVAPGPSCGKLSAAPVPAGNAAREVTADATGLEPTKAYYVVLVASNLGGTEEATTAASPSFTTPAAAPLVKAFAAGPVSSDRASINGEVNPQNSPTTYWFEWGTENCETSSCTAVPATEDAVAGSDDFFHYVTYHLEGLAPETTYHFRLIAENGSGITTGPDEEFTTAATPPAVCPNEARRSEQQSAYLPDCRAYEMVSPPDKNGGDVMEDSARTRAAVSGDAIGFTSLVGSGDAQGSGVGFEYLSRRTAAPGTQGWATHGSGPQQDAATLLAAFTGSDSLYVGDLGADASCGVYTATVPLAGIGSPLDAPSNLYLRDGLLGPGPGSTTLITEPATPQGPTVESTDLAGTTADCHQVLFQTATNLTADASGGARKLYEWDQGALRLAGRVPPAGEIECEDGGSVPCEPAPTSIAGLGADFSYTPGMLSPDGRRAFFAVPASGNVYMREDGARTVQLNASEKEPPESPQAASLWLVSGDGNRAFFITSEQLTDDAPAEGGLYAWDAVPDGEGHHLTFLAPAQSVVGASADGSYVYFISDRQLLLGQPSAAFGLYLWHDGVLSFIGGLQASGDAGLDSVSAPPGFNPLTSRVTPDGRHLFFLAKSGSSGLAGRGGFPGYDQGTTCTHDNNTGTVCREQYVYDADSGALRCASCDPGGTAVSDALINIRGRGTGATTTTNHLSRALSADGRWAFFSTGQALVPEDTNGAYDAYAYDTRTEQPHLLSSGTDPSDSYFLDASPDGSDVFFVTRQQLVGWDTDGAYDLYDARVGGGFPEPPAQLASCEGESCRPGAAPRPAAPLVGSTQTGAGNLTRRACPKGKHRVRRHGKARCVKRRHRRKHHHRHKRTDHNRRASR